MNQTDRQLLDALMEGDLSAGMAFIDRLTESGDERSVQVRKDIGSFVRQTNKLWEDVQTDDPDELMWGPAYSVFCALEELNECLSNLFCVELLKPEDVQHTQELFNQSIRMLEGQEDLVAARAKWFGRG